MLRRIFSIIALFLGVGLFGLSYGEFVVVEDGKKADLVIYSFDRPLQLYALLESVDKYVSGLGEVHVIYRASDNEYASAYKEVEQAFGGFIFAKQGDNPYEDFRPLTLSAAFDSPHEYIVFAVDDIIVKDFINVPTEIDLIEKTGAYGFYYRLGKHLDYCHPMNCPQKVPPLTEVSEGVFSWVFSQGECDWAYPNSVDMTLFRKKDIIDDYYSIPLTSPCYEAPWSGRAWRIMSRTGLCYEQSKIVNVPLNRVQNICRNRHMGVSPKNLLDMFNQGLKIDIKPFFRVDNKSAHAEYDLQFVKRTNEKHIVVVTAGYNNEEWFKRNLDSLFEQKYNNYTLWYTDDCSTDNTANLVEEYIKEKGQKHRVKLVCNTQNIGALANQYRAIHSCRDNHIIVILDGDDWLADDQVLNYISDVYSGSDIWLTYGQFEWWQSGQIGICHRMPQEVVKNNQFRGLRYVPSHLRTFYAGLFKKIRREDLLIDDDFLPVTGDVATMLPMIEMARDGHFRFVDKVLLIYNDANELNDHKLSRKLQFDLDLEIRCNRQPYDTIEKPF